MRHAQIQIYLPGNLVYFYCITLLYCYLAHFLAWSVDFQEDLKAFSSRLLSQLSVSFTWARWHSHPCSLLHSSGTLWILEMEGIPGVSNTRASPVDAHLLSALVVLRLEALVIKSFKNISHFLGLLGPLPNLNHYFKLLCITCLKGAVSIMRTRFIAS